VQGSSNEERKSGVLKGKSVSKSPLWSQMSKSRTGELVTEVGAETVSVISDSEVCTCWHNCSVLSKWHDDKKKGFDSEVAGDMNAGEKLSVKWFSNVDSGKMLSSFSDPFDWEGNENHEKISSLISNSSVLTTCSVSKAKTPAGVCCIFSWSWLLWSVWNWFSPKPIFMFDGNDLFKYLACLHVCLPLYVTSIVVGSSSDLWTCFVARHPWTFLCVHL